MRFPGKIGLPVTDNFQMAIGREDFPVRVRSKIEDHKGWCSHFAIRVACVAFSGEVWNQRDPLFQIAHQLNPREADVSFIARWIEPDNGTQWIIATINSVVYKLAAIVKGKVTQASARVKHNPTCFRGHKHDPDAFDFSDRGKSLDHEFSDLLRASSALAGVFAVHLRVNKSDAEKDRVLQVNVDFLFLILVHQILAELGDLGQPFHQPVRARLRKTYRAEDQSNEDCFHSRRHWYFQSRF